MYSVMRENPYRLAEDVSGVGFRIADEIAGKIGIHTDSDYRIRSGILYTLLQAVGEGHCYLPLDLLLRRASELLGVSRKISVLRWITLSWTESLWQREKQYLLPLITMRS